MPGMLLRHGMTWTSRLVMTAITERLGIHWLITCRNFDYSSFVSIFRYQRMSVDHDKRTDAAAELSKPETPVTQIGFRAHPGAQCV